MGKLNIFVITLDNPMGIYQANTTVQGYVTVELNQPMKMKGIRLKFHGGADVHWTESHSRGSGKKKKRSTSYYWASETYFDQTVVLFGNAEGGGGFLGTDSPEHPAGRYTYQFSLLLPPNLPSSFEGAHGHVRYYLKGTIDRPWKFDRHTKKAFTVTSNLDLNGVPNVLNPSSGSDTNTVCCLCCASGPIEATLTINRHGYVPGENIIITGEVNNNSNWQARVSEVVLIQSIEFHARTKSRQVDRKITSINKGNVAAGDRVSFNNDTLHIPPLPPSHLMGCNIIDIKYILKMSSMHLEVPLEVIIGTNPLHDVMASYGYGWEPPTQHGRGAPSGRPGPPPIMSQPAASTYPPPSTSAPPPSYAECIFGKISIKERDDNMNISGDLKYAPMYTYYKWDQPPAGSISRKPSPVVTCWTADQ